jgi:hypothetical protein
MKSPARLTLSEAGVIKIHPYGGAVAQLEARLDGIEEVEGSNPFGSTKFFSSLPVSSFCRLTQTCGRRMFLLKTPQQPGEKDEQT